MLVLDAQVHIWEADSPEHPWTPELAHHAGRGSHSLDQLRAQMDRVGIDGAVLVGVPWDRYRTDLIVDAAERFPERFAAMAALDLESPRLRDEAGCILACPGVKGVRFAFWGHTGAALDRGDYDPLWRDLERRGTPTAMFAPQNLGAVEQIGRRHPGLPIALCHLGMLRKQTEPSIDEMVRRLVALAYLPNVSLKATGLPVPSGEPWPHRDLHAPLERLLAAYGPERMFWGSDVTRIERDGSSYSDSLALFTDELSCLRGDALELVLGRALARWLDWPPGCANVS